MTKHDTDISFGERCDYDQNFVWNLLFEAEDIHADEW